MTSKIQDIRDQDSTTQTNTSTDSTTVGFSRFRDNPAHPEFICLTCPYVKSWAERTAINQHTKMSSNHHDDFLQSSAKQIYDEEMLKDLRERLEIRYGSKLSKTKPPGEYQLVCKTKECGFLIRFRETSVGNYQQFESYPQHDCGNQFAVDELAFFENRKKVIDLKSSIYTIMKERYQSHGFEKPKKYMALLTFHGELGEVGSIYEQIENAEDRRKLKKKFDNVVADVKNQVLMEDPELKAKVTDELRNKRKRKKTLKGRLTCSVKKSNNNEDQSYIKKSSVRVKREANEESQQDESTGIMRKANNNRLSSKNLMVKVEAPSRFENEGHNNQGVIMHTSSNSNYKQSCKTRDSPVSGLSTHSTKNITAVSLPVLPAPPVPEPIDFDNYLVEYDVEQTKSNVLLLTKDFFRKDNGTRVIDEDEWRKINAVIEEHELNEYNDEDQAPNINT